MFQMFSPSMFFLSNRKKNKEKKTMENKRNAKKGGSFPSSSRFALSLLDPSFALPLLPFHFCPFVSNIFSLHILFLKQKKKKKKKKTKEKKKNVEKGGNFPSSSCSTLSLLVLASALPLLPFCFKRSLLASSYSQAKKKTQRKKKP
jgi:hypothetical protein